MPWSNGVYTRSNGVFTGSTVWASDEAVGTDITTEHHDYHDQDLANGLNQCMTIDGLNGLHGSFIPSADATYDLGSGTYRWANAYFSGAVNTGSLTSTGALAASTVTANAGGTALSAPNGNLSVGGTALVSGTLHVDGVTTLAAGGYALTVPSGSINVAGASVFSNNLAVGGTLNVSGQTALNGSGTAALYMPSGGMTVAGNGNFGASVSVGTTLAVGGQVTLNGPGYELYIPNGASYIVGASIFGGALQVNGTLTAGGGGTLGSFTINSSVLNSNTINSSNLYSCGLFSCGLSGGSATSLSLISPQVTGGMAVYGGLGVSNGLNTDTLSVNGGGTPMSIPNGNLYVAGPINCGGSGTFQTGGTAVYAPNGDIIAAGALQGSSLACYGPAYIAGTLSVAGGVEFDTYLVVTVNNCQKPTGGQWSSISDSRIKKNVAPYTRGLADVLNINPVTYEFNGKAKMHDDGITNIGLVADDVLPVMPEMVGKQKVKLEPTDEEDTEILTLDASALMYALTNAVKELSARLKALEEKS